MVNSLKRTQNYLRIVLQVELEIKIEAYEKLLRREQETLK